MALVSGNAELVARQVRSLLTDFLETIPVPLNEMPPVQFDCELFLDRVERLAALIAFWGTRINLTSAPEDPWEIGFHVIDSLAPLALFHSDESLGRALRPGRRWLDMGSGAGFPGLILAAASSASFTLLERRQRRASFLNVAAADIGLQNVTIEHKRGERDARFDAVTARAFATAPIFHSAAASALKPGGVAILYANPGQDLALQEAEENGLHELRKVAYTVPRHGRWVQRILGLWRRHAE